MKRAIGLAIQEREDEIKFAANLDGPNEQTFEILEILQLARLGIWAEERAIPTLRSSLNEIAFSNLKQSTKDKLRETAMAVKPSASCDAGF